jgi:hypothetical protein
MVYGFGVSSEAPESQVSSQWLTLQRNVTEDPIIQLHAPSQTVLRGRKQKRAAMSRPFCSHDVISRILLALVCVCIALHE